MEIPVMNGPDCKVYVDHYFTVRVVESLVKDKGYEPASGLMRLSDKEYRTYFFDKTKKNTIFVTSSIKDDHIEVSIHIGDFELWKNVSVNEIVRSVVLPQDDLTTDNGKLHRERMIREALAKIWTIRTSLPAQKRGKMNIGPEVRIELDNDPIRGIREVRVFDYSKINEKRRKAIQESEENAGSINYTDFNERFGDKLSDKERIQKLRSLDLSNGNNRSPEAIHRSLNEGRKEAACQSEKHGSGTCNSNSRKVAKQRV